MFNSANYHTDAFLGCHVFTSVGKNYHWGTGGRLGCVIFDIVLLILVFSPAQINKEITELY